MDHSTSLRTPEQQTTPPRTVRHRAALLAGFALLAIPLTGASPIPAPNVAPNAEQLAQQRKSVDRLGMKGKDATVIGFQRNGQPVGYQIPAPYNACAPWGARAFRYLATDDRNGLDNRHRGIPGDPARIGQGFERLHQALARHGLTVADIRLEFGDFTLTTPAFPLAAVDASPTKTERRTYSGAKWRLRVRDPNRPNDFPVAVHGTTGTLTLDVAYNNPGSCNDDRTSGRVSADTPDLYVSNNAVATDIGTAIRTDLVGRKVNFRFDDFQPAMKNKDEAETFSGGDIALGARFTAGTALFEAIIP